MTYTTLTAPKGSVGSILNWAGYGKVDIATVVDEVQFLIYETLRVREMRSSWTFGVVTGQESVSLPTRFLEPVGKIIDLTNGDYYDQLPISRVFGARSYDSSISGTFGTNPFTTTLGSGDVMVSQTNEPFNQSSSITIANAPVLNGMTMTGTFEVKTITDTNDFIIDVGGPTDTFATASGNGGGTGVTFTGNNLIAGTPCMYGILAKKIHFDVAWTLPAAMKLLYYRQPQLLSATFPNNFLTDRYPNLVRTAALALSAKYMKDDNEWTKQTTELVALIQAVAVENDMYLNGAIMGTDTP